uniref:Uncharacterized protein n=1 Tax=Balaenoptera musculus TaxID=9771 RepID=A0A8C0E5M2_BALMU
MSVRPDAPREEGDAGDRGPEAEPRGRASSRQRQRRQATRFLHKDSADLLPLDGLKRLGTSEDWQPHNVIQRRLVEGNPSRPLGEHPLVQAAIHSQESRRRTSKTERPALLVNCTDLHFRSNPPQSTLSPPAALLPFLIPYLTQFCLNCTSPIKNSLNSLFVGRRPH